jgi:hypothetical protein
MNARDQFSKAVDRLEHQRALLLSAIETLNQVQLDFKPSRQSWSIGQIAHHVGLGEVVWRGYLKSLLKDGAARGEGCVRVSLNEVPFHSRFIPDFVLRSPFVLGPLSLMIDFMPRPLQSMFFTVPLVKMDAGARMQPKLGMSHGQVLKFLADTRRATLEVLDPLSEKDLTRYRIVHPLVGDQNVYGVMDLLASHEKRHTQQIEGIKRNPEFPGADGTAE